MDSATARKVAVNLKSTCTRTTEEHSFEPALQFLLSQRKHFLESSILEAVG